MTKYITALMLRGAQATSSSSRSRFAISKCLSLPLLSALRVLRNYEQTVEITRTGHPELLYPELHSKSDYFISIIGFCSSLVLQ
jgi:hypothetical protein